MSPLLPQRHRNCGSVAETVAVSLKLWQCHRNCGSCAWALAAVPGLWQSHRNWGGVTGTGREAPDNQVPVVTPAFVPKSQFWQQWVRQPDVNGGGGIPAGFECRAASAGQVPVKYRCRQAVATDTDAETWRRQSNNNSTHPISADLSVIALRSTLIDPC